MPLDEIPQTDIPFWIKDSRQLGLMMVELTHAYTHIRWRYPEALVHIPQFLAKELGMPIYTLPTFRAHEEDQMPPLGLGIFIDAVHREMRNLAKEVGKKFLPELEKIGISKPPPAQCPFAAKIEPLENKHTAEAEIKIGGKTVKFTANAPQIATRGFSTFAASKGILQRPEEERTIVENITGSIATAYDNVMELAQDLVAAIKKQHPEYAHLAADDLGLDIARKPELARKAAQALPHMRAVINFLQCSECGLRSSKYIADWVATYEQKPPGQTIYLSTAQDIGGALHGLSYFVFEYDQKLINPHDSWRVVSQLGENCRSLDEAARVLAEGKSRAVLAKLGEFAGRHNLHFATKVLAEITDLRNARLGRDKYPPLNDSHAAR